MLAVRVWLYVCHVVHTSCQAAIKNVAPCFGGKLIRGFQTWRAAREPLSKQPVTDCYLRSSVVDQSDDNQSEKTDP